MSLLVLLIALLAVLLTFGLHYLAVARLSRSLSIHGHKPVAMLAYVIILFIAHLAEIGLYAVAYAGVAWFSPEPLLAGEGMSGGVDYFYFSIVNYTSLGFGDLYPVGAFRLLAGVEALNGLMLITWSASFTFVAMSRLWDGK